MAKDMMLADALLRRKELQQKVDQLRAVKDSACYEFVFERKKVNENIDDIRGRVPVLDINQVTEEYDYYANKLRLIDAAIQRLNWTTSIDVTSKVFMDFVAHKKAA